MSKIDELIAQYCPNGVEYKELGEVVILTMGTSPAGNTFRIILKMVLNFTKEKLLLEMKLSNIQIFILQAR